MHTHIHKCLHTYVHTYQLAGLLWKLNVVLKTFGIQLLFLENKVLHSTEKYYSVSSAVKPEVQQEWRPLESNSNLKLFCLFLFNNKSLLSYQTYIQSHTYMLLNVYSTKDTIVQDPTILLGKMVARDYKGSG